ncbi:hypothetical protein CYMTET_51097, partial [Cymbomonas tetramitiformis]
LKHKAEISEKCVEGIIHRNTSLDTVDDFLHGTPKRRIRNSRSMPIMKPGMKKGLVLTPPATPPLRAATRVSKEGSRTTTSVATGRDKH